MNHSLLPAADLQGSVLQPRARLLLKAGIDAAREAQPADPTAVHLTDGLAMALHAAIVEGRALGLGDDLIDEAVAAALGWLIASGDERPPPMGGDAARRIERFMRRTLRASERTHAARDREPELRGAA